MQNLRTEDLHAIDWAKVVGEMSFIFPESIQTSSTSTKSVAQRVRKNPTWTPASQAHLIAFIKEAIEKGEARPTLFQFLDHLDLPKEHVQPLLNSLEQASSGQHVSALSFTPYGTSQAALARTNTLLRTQTLSSFTALIYHYIHLAPKELSSFLDKLASVAPDLDDEAQDYVTHNLVASAGIDARPATLPPASLSTFSNSPSFLRHVLLKTYPFAMRSFGKRCLVWDIPSAVSRAVITPLLSYRNMDLAVLDETLALLNAPGWKTFYEDISPAELANLLATVPAHIRPALLGLLPRHTSVSTRPGL